MTNDETNDRWYCLKAGPDNTTCLKRYGHEGPHEFVRDDEIVLRFKDDDE
jgi:hypothetical protein